ncbi:site-specific integrase [Flavobacterium salilacus subsp. salilacus]|uniref:site-specific integrase n=1 Tax=Flavobacterium TaxID=237 RepID=UPI0010756065|nr:MULTISPECIES: site-specific integrase [Flavobacterium]KAF2518836.1 site-specific integrase [Flavobacterium salilacus subsp. salilacus]MBE1615005.1 site-specific integrase [Flavobacterium sp. SaA2.13]NDI98715.1 site-specific integrase [Flavobacterium salilacus subsp. altitudinum]
MNNLYITFLITRSRLNAQGKCSMKCRITYKKERHEFAIGLFVNPNHWNSKQQTAKAKPPSEENKNINTQLSLIKNRINRAFLMLQAQEIDFTVEDIYNQYSGKTVARNIGTVAYYNEYLEKYRKLIGIEIKQSTWNKFRYIRTDVQDFIKHRYSKTDLLLKDLDYSFIVEFEFYLKTEKNQKQVTINKALQRLKKVVNTAVIAKLIETSPFIQHKPKKVTTHVVYLTTEELVKLENHTFSQERLQYVKDMFVFCCYTGLAFNEMSRLKEKHIIDGFDGNKWIKMIREKTQREIAVPLLKISTNIIEKYGSDGDKIFPSISNQKFNSYLKEIAEIVGIDKKLTHHIARKTFATTVLLYNDVPMEIVSELLGHSKMSITQEHYGKVVQKKVSEHMRSLAIKLSPKE